MDAFLKTLRSSAYFPGSNLITTSNTMFKRNSISPLKGDNPNHSQKRASMKSPNSSVYATPNKSFDIRSQRQSETFRVIPAFFEITKNAFVIILLKFI